MYKTSVYVLMFISIILLNKYETKMFNKLQTSDIIKSKKMFFESENVKFSFLKKLSSLNLNVITVEDYSGNKITGNFSVNDSSLFLGKMALGWYNVALNNNYTFSFAVVPDRKLNGFKESKFGIHVEITPTGFEKLKYLGAGWIRLHGTGSDILKWSFVEKQKGIYNWNYDLINPFINAGYGILANVGLSPLWASSNPNAESYPNKSSYFGPYAYIPSNINLWKNYLEKAYSEYKNHIDYWEIWNEPDIHFLVSDNKVEDYKKLLSSAIEVKKEESGDFRIAGPAIAYFMVKDNPAALKKFPANQGKKYRDPGFLNNFFEDSLENDLNVFTFHYYKHINKDQFNYDEDEYNNYKEKVDNLKKIIGNKQIFVSEFNVLSNNKYYDAETDNVLSNILVLEHLQLYSAGVDKIFTYTAAERNPLAIWNDFFYNGDNPTQVFQAYSVMTAYLTGYNIESRNYDSNNGLVTFKFTNNVNPITVYFASRNTSVTINKDCIISDNLGQKHRQLAGNKIMLNKNSIYYQFSQ